MKLSNTEINLITIVEVQEYDKAMRVGEPKGIPVLGRIIPTTEERLEIDRFLQEGDERFEAPLGEAWTQ